MERPEDKFEVKTKARGNDGTEFDHQEIKDRLLKIMESDPEGGREKVSLFAARNGLRVFPFAVSGILDRSVDLKNYGKSKWLSIVWRALIIAWTNDQKLATTAASAAAKAAAKAYNVTASAAIAATADVAGIAATAATATDATNAGTATATTIATTIAYAATDAATKFDLEMFENSEFTILDLRRKPLWPESRIPELISDTHWKTVIADWVSDHSNDENDSEILILSKISQVYDSIIKGTWIDDKPVEPLTVDSADEKPQNDSPSNIDYLGRDQLVNSLTPRLSVKDVEDHLTIGLFGDWGIGKSSVIEQLREKLKKVEHCDYVFGEFNAWSYEHTPNLQAGIAHEVISALTTQQPRKYEDPEEELPPEKKWPWYRRWSYKLYVTWKFAISLHGKRILVILGSIFIAQVSGFFQLFRDFMSSNPALAGAGSLVIAYFVFKELKTIMSQPLAKELKTYLQLPSYQKHLGTIPEMEKNIKALCNICLGPKIWGKNRRLVFFVDDLDRCGVDGIVKTFEAVRLVLDIPWVTVIIAMDQRIALPALACHYEKLSKYHQRDPMSIARDYLGKVIHLPIRLQAPDNQSVARYLAHIWDDPDFVKKINAEQSPEQTVSPQPDIKSKQQDNVDFPADKLKESLEDIIRDIDSMDVKSQLQVVGNGPEPTTVQGFGKEQKEKFYHWLIKFNLRNPRQIKRLYNSYNLLWSIYDGKWKEDGDAWYPNMLALLVLEMINEHVPFDEKVDTREQYRQAYFSSRGDEKVIPIENIDSADVNEAQTRILDYQTKYEIKLLECLEPFVLPAIRPQDINKKNGY